MYAWYHRVHNLLISPPQGRQDILLERPTLQHAGDTEERRHEHGVENQGVYQKVGRGGHEPSRGRRDEALQHPVESVQRGARDEYAVDSHRQQSAGVLGEQTAVLRTKIDSGHTSITW